jgi:UDP-N-acetylmuramate dehydrogenase
MTLPASCIERRLFNTSAGKAMGRLIPGALMSLYTTIKIGGRSRGIFVPKDAQGLIKFIIFCKKNKISLLPIGNGSNIIVSDKGLENIFLRLSSPYFKGIIIHGNSITCGAGAMVNSLCNAAQRHSLSGMEFLTGIPAQAGGVVFQNAGAHFKQAADIIKNIRCLNPHGDFENIKADSAYFDYRQSRLSGYIILSVEFKLKKSTQSDINKLTAKYLKYRLLNHDYTAPSAGCVFKNPKGFKLTAGEMIDQCGLKGAHTGDAYVSQKHANFIINKGKAKADDVLKLMRLIKRKVKTVYGVDLETEVKIL